LISHQASDCIEDATMASQKSNVYQIDFTAVASGKRIASSKRRVRWRFGFANTDALNNGETGTACRGEEHDVTLVWSITSGKRLVLADGQEVHYSHNRNGILDFSWTMRGNHVLKIVAHASPPMAPTPGWRQYDFFVDGQSFFSFPKVYRLGLATNDPRAKAPGNPARLAETGQRMKGPPPAGRSEIATLEAPTNPQEEEAYLQAAINESMKDASTMKAPENASTDYGDLLDFGSVAPEPVQNNPFGAGPAPAVAALPPSTTAQSGYPPAAAAQPNPYAPAPPAAQPNPYALVPAAAQPNPYANPYGAPPPAAPGQFAALPAPAPADAAPYGAPAGSFGAPAAEPAKPAPIETQQPNGVAPPAQVTPQAQPTPSSLGFASPPTDFSGFSPQAGPAPTAAAPETPQAEPPAAAPADGAAEPAPASEQPKLTMNSLSGQGGLLGDGGTSQQASGSMADQAYNRLAMLDSFTLGAKPQAENPFEANNNVVGGHKTLADMKSKKDTSNGGKEIMKSTPASVMVVSGTQNGNWGAPAYGQPQMGGMQPQMGGPPPLGQPQMQMQQQLGMQPQMGGPPPLGQPQMGGMQPQMGGPPPLGQPQMYQQQPQMGQPGQYPPSLQQQPFGGFGQG